MTHLGRLFVSMAIMFPWATKEYLLWEMSLGQLVMYHNIGIELKYPRPDEGDKPSLRNMTPAQLKEVRDAARKMLAEDQARKEADRSEAEKEKYRQRYGDV